MKRVYAVITVLIITVILGSSLKVAGQRLNLPVNLVGVDLKEVQKQYLRGIDKGIDSLLIPYAEALYYDGQIRKSFESYQRADSLKLSFTRTHKRNFAHAARRLGQSSPYDQNTGYFSDKWQPRAEVRKTGSNSPEEDFAPFVWRDKLFVTSSRQDVNRRSQERYMFTNMPFLKVYAFNHQYNSSAGIDFLPATINTTLHNGPIAISLDTSLLVITRNYETPDINNLQNLYLDYYVRDEDGWSKAMPFPENDKTYSIQHPYYYDSTKTLYFSSDKPGGYGGFDLYKAVWDGEEWGASENLGSNINSPYDEVFPSFTPEGHLVYGSNHLETTGGLDLVLYKDNARHLFPEPFNTVYDDLTITFLTDTSGYFASNRNQLPFNDDIYFFSINPSPFLVRVVDSESNALISEVNVSYRADEPAIEGQLLTSAQGEGLLYTGTEGPFAVDLSLTKEGYYPKEITSDNFISEDNRWVLTIELDPVPIEVTISQIIPDGYFIVYFDNDQPDPNSWSPVTDLSYDETFRAYKQRWPEYFEQGVSSRQELEDFFDEVGKGMYYLDLLIKFLEKEFEQGREYAIDFTSHASPLSTDEYNLILSRRRFVSVENFFKKWESGTLQVYINQHLLNYDNSPYGSSLATSDVPGDRGNPASIYSVKAAKERRVTVSWRRINPD
jgi:hypothetical protein